MATVTFRRAPEPRRPGICVDGQPAGLTAYREKPGMLVIARHPEWLALVPESRRGPLGL